MFDRVVLCQLASLCMSPHGGGGGQNDPPQEVTSSFTDRRGAGEHEEGIQETYVSQPEVGLHDLIDFILQNKKQIWPQLRTKLLSP